MNDYQRMAEAINFIHSSVSQQPSLADVANHIHLSPSHFQKLFSRWAGVSPKKYLQVLTVERAKHLLVQSRANLTAAEEIGLSSSSRLHDHFVKCEAVTPGEFKQQGQGLTIEYGSGKTPFGVAFIARTPRGICRLEFIDAAADSAPLNRLKKEWPNATIHVTEHAQTLLDNVFSRENLWGQRQRLPIHVKGTNFQIQVWKALLQISPRQLACYKDIATAVNRPTAVRAAGTAVGANPLAFLIPCHRVIRQNGELGGYRWGLNRKQAIYVWESVNSESKI